MGDLKGCEECFFASICCIICIVLGVTAISVYFYETSCWKPDNDFYCQSKPLSGIVVQNILTSSNCYNTICYSGYSKICYNENDYCYITNFMNSIISNSSAYIKSNSYYNINEKVYINLDGGNSCSEYIFQKSTVITSLVFMFLFPGILAILCVLFIINGIIVLIKFYKNDYNDIPERNTINTSNTRN